MVGGEFRKRCLSFPWSRHSSRMSDPEESSKNVNWEDDFGSTYPCLWILGKCSVLSGCDDAIAYDFTRILILPVYTLRHESTEVYKMAEIIFIPLCVSMTMAPAH